MINKDGSMMSGGYKNNVPSNSVTSRQVLDKQVRISHQFDTDWDLLGFGNSYYIRENDTEGCLELTDMEIDSYYELYNYNNMKFKGFIPKNDCYLFYDLDTSAKFKKYCIKYEDMAQCVSNGGVKLSPKQCYKLETILEDVEGEDLKEKLTNMLNEHIVKKNNRYENEIINFNDIRDNIKTYSKEIYNKIKKLNSKEEKKIVIDNIFSDLERIKEKENILETSKKKDLNNINEGYDEIAEIDDFSEIVANLFLEDKYDFLLNYINAIYDMVVNQEDEPEVDVKIKSYNTRDIEKILSKMNASEKLQDIILNTVKHIDFVYQLSDNLGEYDSGRNEISINILHLIAKIFEEYEKRTNKKLNFKVTAIQLQQFIKKFDIKNWLKETINHEIQHAYDDKISNRKALDNKQNDKYERIKDNEEKDEFLKIKTYFNLTHEVNARFTETVSRSEVKELINDMRSSETKEEAKQKVKFNDFKQTFIDNFDGYVVLESKVQKRIVTRISKLYNYILDKYFEDSVNENLNEYKSNVIYELSQLTKKLYKNEIYNNIETYKSLLNSYMKSDNCFKTINTKTIIGYMEKIKIEKQFIEFTNKTNFEIHLCFDDVEDTIGQFIYDYDDKETMVYIIIPKMTIKKYLSNFMSFKDKIYEEVEITLGHELNHLYQHYVSKDVEGLHHDKQKGSYYNSHLETDSFITETLIKLINDKLITNKEVNDFQLFRELYFSYFQDIYDELSDNNKKKVLKNIYSFWNFVNKNQKVPNDSNKIKKIISLISKKLDERIIDYMKGNQFVSIKTDKEMKGKPRNQGDIDNIKLSSTPDLSKLHGMERIYK